MRLPRNQARRRSGAPGEAFILFTVGGTTFAIAAQAVDEIRNLDGLRPLTGPRSMPAKVCHLLERDRRTYIVVDAAHHFHLLPLRLTRLLVLRHANVAVLVESIVRMAEIKTMSPLPLAFSGEERQWYRGLALLPDASGESVVPVVDPDAFLSAQERLLLASAPAAQGAHA